MNFENLKNFMEYMAAEKTPGNAINVYWDGKLAFKYACGVSDIDTKSPLTGDEYFNIYSCSKITTVTAGMQLLERGEFLLTDPLCEYIPEYKNMYIKNKDGILTEAKNKITIGDLFTMTSGMTYELESDAIKKAKELTGGKMDTVTVVKALACEPLSFEPGTHWQYSLSHDVLAGLISVISGKKFRDYVQENIFAPLDMKETVFHHTEKTKKSTMSQYEYHTENNKFVNVGKNVARGYVMGEEYDSGGAGLTSKVHDYAKLIAALANRGMGLTGERILSEYSVELMRTNRLNNVQLRDFNWNTLAGCGYGLGLRTHINKVESGIISNYGESGWGGAAGATAFFDPDINLAVFYTQHTLNQKDEFSEPKLRNVVYSCLNT